MKWSGRRQREMTIEVARTRNRSRMMLGDGIDPFIQGRVELCNDMLFPLGSDEPK